MLKRLRAAVAGCRMGAVHAAAYVALEEYDLCALCDISSDTLYDIGRSVACTALFTNYSAMLRKAKPDVVCIATPNALHEQMTLEAVYAGVRGVYCEKPVTLSMGSAMRMHNACRDAGIPLVIGHQRRMSSPYLKMRELIVGGVIGKVYLMRGTCPGDLLSDGTHLIDSLLFLNGDTAVRWVLGQVYRGRKATAEELARNRFQYCGVRYGHNVEEGAISVFEFENGVRGETHTGTLWLPGRGYQDIEVFGDGGRLLRAGDGVQPALSIDCGHGWQPVAPDGDEDGLMAAHRQFYRTVTEGADHPLSIASAIRGFEVLMAVYESARLHARLDLPLAQMEFPLDLMLAQGQIQ